MRRFVAFILGFTLMWGLLGTLQVLGQDMRGNGMAMGPLIGSMSGSMVALCPPDKPIRRVVEQPIASCTLLACQKMVCEKDSDRCKLTIGADCNTCSRAPDVVVCLSQEELDAAK